MRTNGFPIIVQFETTPQVVNALSRLLATGLFGRTIPGVAEELLRAKLRELQTQGFGKR